MILAKGKTVEEVELTLNTELCRFVNWFHHNKLSLNANKTKAMLFTSSRNKQNDSKINVMSGAASIEHVGTYKYLGMWLDPFLSFDVHIDKVCAKVKARTGLLWRMRNCISKLLASDLYYSLIHPHFLFGDTVYDGCNQTAKHKLQVHQNMALRAVANVGRHFSATAVHDVTNATWLDIERQKHCCNTVYKSLNGLTAINVSAMFIPVNHQRETRAQVGHMYQQPLARTNFGSQNLPIRAYNYWKAVPTAIRGACSLNSFKYHMKSFNGFTHNYKH